MSCLLRISGPSLDVQELLLTFALPFDRVWKKGEQRIVEGRFHTDSGVTFLVSDADLNEIDRQVLEATEYLTKNASVIEKMILFPGVQDAFLDFGVSIGEGYLSQSTYLPAKLIQLAAHAGIGIEISHYACCDDDHEE